jgi:glycosyltransferase involved in cell wall biosynthesis
MPEICLIAKYPPVEGGASSQAYWLSRALGRRGLKVHVVSNALEVEPEYKEFLTAGDAEELEPKNVYVNYTSPKGNLNHVIFDRDFVERLAGLALCVFQKSSPDIIDSWYLVPYAVAGFLVKTFTGRSQVIRHEGSDINKIFRSQEFRPILTKILQSSERLIANSSTIASALEQLGITKETIVTINRCVDTSVFTPDAKPLDLSPYLGRDLDANEPIVAHIGKPSLMKGTLSFIEALKHCNERFKALIVCGSSSFPMIADLCHMSSDSSRIILIPFVPPWKMPSLLRRCSCLVFPERSFPSLGHLPILPREAMASGVPALVSPQLLQRYMIGNRNLRDGVDIVPIDPSIPRSMAAVIDSVIRGERFLELGSNARYTATKSEDYQKYITLTESVYEDLCHEGSHKPLPVEIPRPNR